MGEKFTTTNLFAYQKLGDRSWLTEGFEEEVEDVGDNENAGYLKACGDQGVNGIDGPTHYLVCGLHCLKDIRRRRKKN